MLTFASLRTTPLNSEDVGRQAMRHFSITKQTRSCWDNLEGGQFCILIMTTHFDNFFLLPTPSHSPEPGNTHSLQESLAITM